MASIEREFSKRFSPEIKRLVGQHLLVDASEDLDTKEATDFVLFKARDLRVAARIRNATTGDWNPKWNEQFTIRTSAPAQLHSELQKIVMGFADLMFYGLAESVDPPRIGTWYLIDLNAFRLHYSECLAGTTELKHGELTNRDGSRFRWFALSSFPARPPILRAQSVSGPAKSAHETTDLRTSRGDVLIGCIEPNCTAALDPVEPVDEDPLIAGIYLKCRAGHAMWIVADAQTHGCRLSYAYPREVEEAG